MRKNMLVVYMAGLALIVLLGTSCTPSKPSNKYFPIEKGMKWEYQTTANKPVTMTSMTKGTATSKNINARDWKMTVTVETEEIIEGKKYFKIVIAYSGLAGADPTIIYRRIADDGIYEMKEGSKEYLWIPFPITDKKPYDYFNPDIGNNIKCNAEKVDNVYVGGKTYNDGLIITSEYQSPDDNKYYKNTAYYAANIGLIRLVQYNKTANVTVESVLVENKR